MTKKEIIARYGQAYYDAHLEKTKVNAKLWYYANPDRHKTPEQNKAAVARWLAKPGNLEKQRKRGREVMAAKSAAMTPEQRKERADKAYERLKNHRAANPAFDEEFCSKAKARSIAWREANRDHCNERARQWAAAHPEYRRTIAIVMAAQRRGAGPMDREFVAWIRQQPCIDCGAIDHIEVGHIVSIKDGGTNDPANLLPQCRSCNRRLSSKPHRLVGVKSAWQ